MQINVLLFAAAKEAANSDRVSVTVPVSARASDVMAALADQIPPLAGILPSSRLAVDNCYVDGDQLVGEHSEVALIPPVSGG
jgi:molybdopterin converting factor subunit 1